MSLHSSVAGHITDPTTVINVLTNGSGVSQALSIWDVTFTIGAAWNAAGGVRQLAVLAVNGVLVCQASLILLQNTTANYSAYYNLQGFQYAFPNGSNVTLTLTGAPTFWDHTIEMNYDVVTGS